MENFVHQRSHLEKCRYDPPTRQGTYSHCVGDYSQERHIVDVPMLPLGRAILLMGMRTRNMVRYANMLEKGIKRPPQNHIAWLQVFYKTSSQQDFENH
jgi:hypothetical protein